MNAVIPSRVWSWLTVNDSPVLACGRPALSQVRDGDTAGALARIEAGLRARPGDALLVSAQAEIVLRDAENRERAAALGLAAPPPPAAVLHHALAVRLARAGDATGRGAPSPGDASGWLRSITNGLFAGLR